ncbi:type II toxin-antitoxin system VapC family toxin [Raoultibacter phocaeensis]|uniref:type II toxin-antitoxin system VapC family toxin n=1 Tax=Raoultibacter phocaeensis TaxID=2479841 RepID=UPI0011196089|nr:type II toxin-antitoxin system VapC family toxin [Raoultibacter phocaeensis]
MLFLDTCVCIEFLRGTMPNVFKALKAHDPQEIALPAVVEAELRCGALKSAKPQENLLKVELFLAPFKSIPFDSPCAEEYGIIRAELEKDGRVIGPNDLMIAATTRAHLATLVTDNVKEFERVRGLAVESWDVIAFD